MLRASAVCEAAGYPTSSLTCEGFVGQASVTAVGIGMPNIPVAVVPGHIGTKTPQELRADILDVTLDDNITAFGIRRDQAATRERRTLRARYQIVSLATGLVVLDATAGSDAGIDIVSSEYATVAAEQTALEHLADMLADQITARVALYASRSAPAQ